MLVVKHGSGLNKDKHARSNKRARIDNAMRPVKVVLRSGRQDVYEPDAHSY